VRRNWHRINETGFNEAELAQDWIIQWWGQGLRGQRIGWDRLECQEWMGQVGPNRIDRDIIVFEMDRIEWNGIGEIGADGTGLDGTGNDWTE
jgi:hypothetical protein